MPTDGTAPNQPGKLNTGLVKSPMRGPFQHEKSMPSRLRVALFPLDRGRRLAGDVVHHPVDAFDLIDDAAADVGQKIVG